MLTVGLKSQHSIEALIKCQKLNFRPPRNLIPKKKPGKKYDYRNKSCYCPKVNPNRSKDSHVVGLIFKYKVALWRSVYKCLQVYYF